MQFLNSFDVLVAGNTCKMREKSPDTHVLLDIQLDHSPPHSSFFSLSDSAP
jgi:hypothetical protein